MDAYYHLGLSLKGQTCLIIGFGEVGQRKLQGLIATEVANIKIFEPKPSAMAKTLLKDPRISLITEPYTNADLEKAFLIFACTNSEAENLRIAQFCQEHKLLCNCTSSPKEGNVILPATLREGDLTLTIATGGASPALTRKWHQALNKWMLERQPILTFMKRLRPKVLALGQSSKENRELFRKIADSQLEDLLNKSDFKSAENWLKANLPENLHDQIGELLSHLD